MPLPQPKSPDRFGHSSYQDQRGCHGRGQVLDGHGSLHRSIDGVLSTAARSSRGCRFGQARAQGRVVNRVNSIRTLSPAYCQTTQTGGGSTFLIAAKVTPTFRTMGGRGPLEKTAWPPSSPNPIALS